MSLYEFSPITILQPNASLSCTMGINFNDSTQPASINIDFVVKDDQESRNVGIRAPIGEIIRSVIIPETMFLSEKEKLKGMNEHSAKINYTGNRKILTQKIVEAANLAVTSSDDDSIRYMIFYYFNFNLDIPTSIYYYFNISDNFILRFAAQTLASKSLVLVTIKTIEENMLDICVNCEKMVVGSMLLNELKNNLK